MWNSRHRGTTEDASCQLNTGVNALLQGLLAITAPGAAGDCEAGWWPLVSTFDKKSRMEINN